MQGEAKKAGNISDVISPYNLYNSSSIQCLYIFFPFFNRVAFFIFNYLFIYLMCHAHQGQTDNPEKARTEGTKGVLGAMQDILFITFLHFI